MDLNPRVVQVPAPTKVTVAVATVHTPGVALENVTVNPELAVALTVYVAPPFLAVAGAIEVNVIVWSFLLTVNVCCACGAAL